MDGAPEEVEDPHHHHHARNGDHRIAQQRHAAEFGVERLAARRAGDDPLGQHVVHERREEEGSAQPIGGAQQAGLEVFHLAVALQLFVDLVDVDHLRVVQQRADQRVAGPRGSEHGNADHAGNRGFLDGQPLGVQLQQADTASKQHADQPEQGDPVEFAVLDQLEQPPAQRKRQAQHQRAIGAKAILAAELHQDQRRNQDADHQIHQRTWLVFGHGGGVNIGHGSRSSTWRGAMIAAGAMLRQSSITVLRRNGLRAVFTRPAGGPLAEFEGQHHQHGDGKGQQQIQAAKHDQRGQHIGGAQFG